MFSASDCSRSTRSSRSISRRMEDASSALISFSSFSISSTWIGVGGVAKGTCKNALPKYPAASALALGTSIALGTFFVGAW